MIFNDPEVIRLAGARELVGFEVLQSDCQSLFLLPALVKDEERQGSGEGHG